MSSSIIIVPKCNDRQFLNFFDRLASELNFSNFSFQIYGSNTSVNPNEHSDIIEKIRGDCGFSVQHAYANRRSDSNQYPNQPMFSIMFDRGKKSQGAGIDPSITIDSITIDGQQIIDPSAAIIINNIIEEELMVRSVPALPGSDGSALADLVQTHHQLITAMRQQLVAVGKDLTKARIDAERELRAQKRELEAAAEAERLHLQAEREDRLREVEVEKEKLAERAKQLDDRDNTHVRRELRKNLQENLRSYKEKFELTEGTRNLRRPVLYSVILIEIICVLLLIIMFIYSPKSVSVWDQIAFWIKTAALTFFGAGTAVWFLKWLTNWSARHADAEFQLRQLELDIDRASWVVETAFEWKSSQESSIPEPLLGAISRNLFNVGEVRGENLESPADHLASALLGDASKIRLRMGDHAEAEWDRPGIKRTMRPS